MCLAPNVYVDNITVKEGNLSDEMFTTEIVYREKLVDQGRKPLNLRFFYYLVQ